MTRLPRPSVPRTLGPALGLLFALSLAGCSTFQAWFTPEGQALSRAQAAAQDGHPLAASAQAAQALDLEPTYAEARQALLKWFAPGQEEFRSQTDLWRASSDPFRWDRLYELYGWQQTLATLGPRLPPLVDPQSGLALNVAVPPVAQDRAEAGRRAAEAHLERAQALLQALPGPRQARQALAEGRRASSFDPDAPGLAPWLSQAEAAAAQRLLVFPFFLQAPGRFGNPSAALGSELSRRLLDSDRLPELTTVFSSDRLATLPGAGPARAGLISQPDALALAAAADQNLVLLGQISRATVQEPQKVTRTEARTRTLTVVDPAHPAGVDQSFKATLTIVEWTASASLSASWALVEVATGADLASGVRDESVQSQIEVYSFTGDPQALTDDDRRNLADHSLLEPLDVLQDRAVAALASSLSDAVLAALRP